jgi:hypothetical protein
MKTQPNPSDREVLAGLVERVTYHNVENGFCVLRSSGFGEPKQPSNTLVQPSPTTQVPIAAQDLADRKSLAPIIIAMNVVFFSYQ